MDAIQLIRRDHRALEQLFTRFARAHREGALADEQRAVRELVRELSVHAAIEEQLVYPVLREDGGDHDVLGALEEHHLVKVTLAELERLDARHPRYAAKVELLAANVRAHVEEEERALLPRLEAALDAEQLRDLGDTLEAARRAAPTRPHPAAPDTPPANLVAGAVAAVFDRARDAVRGGVEMLRLVLERGAARGGALARRLARRTSQADGAVREVRARGRAIATEAREAAGDVWAVGAEAVDDLRARGREATDRTEAGALRMQQGARAMARELRGRSGVRGADGKPGAPARPPGRPRRKPQRKRR